MQVKIVKDRNDRQIVRRRVHFVINLLLFQSHETTARDHYGISPMTIASVVH